MLQDIADTGYKHGEIPGRSLILTPKERNRRYFKGGLKPTLNLEGMYWIFSQLFRILSQIHPAWRRNTELCSRERTR